MNNPLTQIESYSFKLDKKNALSKIDKSKKGSIDKAIIELLNNINRSDNYFSLSSCSGRIVIYEHETMFMSKKEYTVLFSTHEKLTEADIKLIKNIIYTSEKELWIKVEPLILHIGCKNLELASRLINFANNLGFRHSGVVGISLIKSKSENKKVKKIVVEIKGNYIINAPMIKDELYLNYILKEANRYFNLNSKDINKFEIKINNII